MSAYDDLDRPPLDRPALRRALVRPGSLWTDVVVLEETPSTNAVVKQQAGAGAPDGLVVIAEHQTSGRGRLDRSWTSPSRSGLTMSALIRPYDVATARWPWIGLATGLAVATAIRDVTGLEASLKWPNDVLISGRKVAGILVERVDAPRHPPAAVIGIGMNVSMRADELPVESATSIAIELADKGGGQADRSVLARVILRTLDGLLGAWQRHSGDASYGLHAAYAAACSTLGSRVRIEQPDATAQEGIATGIDGGGRLLVATRDGQRVFGSGDIVHLRSLI